MRDLVGSGVKWENYVLCPRNCCVPGIVVPRIKRAKVIRRCLNGATTSLASFGAKAMRIVFLAIRLVRRDRGVRNTRAGPTRHGHTYRSTPRCVMRRFLAKRTLAVVLGVNMSKICYLCFCLVFPVGLTALVSAEEKTSRSRTSTRRGCNNTLPDHRSRGLAPLAGRVRSLIAHPRL